MVVTKKSFLAAYVLVFLFSSNVFGMGASLKIKSLKFKPQGEFYTGLGQRTKEARYTSSDHIFLEYDINGEPRRLWDDDGFATLYLYHRQLASQSLDSRKFSYRSPLPQPIGPLLKALDMLEKAYVDAGEVGKSVLPKIREVKEKFQSVKTVGDLRASGLEKLLGELDSNHNHMVEVGEDKNVRKLTRELIAVGSPRYIGDSVVARCRDSIEMDWSAVTKDFESVKGSKAQPPPATR